MFDCIHCYYILLKSKIKGSADLLELGSQVIIFSTACFPDVAVGSVDPAWTTDNKVSGQGSCSVEKAVILSVVMAGYNINCKKAFLANDF